MWGGRGILTKPLCMEESRNWMELRTTGLAALVEEKKKQTEASRVRARIPGRIPGPFGVWVDTVTEV